MNSALDNKTMKKKKYKKQLKKLQEELVQLQGHIIKNGLKVVIVFEGRDSAGKGGSIKRIVDKLDPNHVRVVAKGKPTDAEEKQWYFQRWVKEMPSEGEMVIFDRSWYTRAGVESVMNFASEEQVASFLKDCPSFEKSLVRQGVIVLKYWLSITHQTQENRFHERLNKVTKRWKLSPMDLKSRHKWLYYTRAKERMFRKTHTKHCPWYIVDNNCKRTGRLNLIRHILDQFDFERTALIGESLPEVAVNHCKPNPEFESLRVCSL
ncbi:polyphosphate kinase 2 [Vibrio sp. SCSIO 43140]|uniref:polyphosphate kinase 2 n=1 Tax=Vibrio sp. SCSIO 43140 TaxID=2819100 RepID=UPI002074EDD3|nr:polyphosphate kinase 2 [Vibrio sp. SCSIO 43140]USD59570.1 polyphosphate kinase 2 [Vibrio sp. SCSIO 43140]